MVAQVRVAGRFLDQSGTVQDVTDSTVWRRGGEWSGDLDASWTWAPPQARLPSWCVRGARVEVVELGVPTWCGRLTETGSGEVLSMAAQGYGAEAAGYMAGSGTASAAVTAAVGRGLPWFVDASVPAGGETNAGTDLSMTLADQLGAHADSLSRRWHVNSQRLLSYRPDPTTPRWVLVPGTSLVATIDTEYVTHLAARYMDSETTTTTTPVYAGPGNIGDRTAERFGRVERVVDLTPLGTISDSAAFGRLVGRYEGAALRMGYTERFDLSDGQVLSATGGPASPLSVRAGHMLVAPDQLDVSTNATVGPVRVIAGEVRRIHFEGRVEVAPVGFVARDFSGALAAAAATDRNASDSIV